MTFPSPEDPALSPVWENYIVAQAVQASLGLIPEHALAVGVVIAGKHIQLQFQLTELSDADQALIEDIAFELESLVGPDVQVKVGSIVRKKRAISPGDGVRWIFLERI